MSRMDPQVIVKLQLVFKKLLSTIDPDSRSESSFLLEDDTTLQKLHTYVDSMMKESEDELVWAQNTGLIDFIQRFIDPSIVNIPDNSSIVAFAIKALASLLSTEGTFENFADDKVMMDFLVIWPNLRNDPTLSSATLNFLEAILKHSSGLSWVIKNGVWEKFLLPSLRSPSIFVQRKGVKTIASFVLLVADTEHFQTYVGDLIMISEKFCELRQHVNRTLGEEIRQSSLCVLYVFKEMYIRTLGKRAMYSKLKDIGDIHGRLMKMLEGPLILSTVAHVTDVLILNALHSFQEKVMEFGIVEQFLVDSLCEDMIILTELLIEKGYIEAFFRSSVNMHKYWILLINNFEEKHLNLKSEESLLHLLTCFQVTPVLVLYKGYVDYFPAKHRNPQKDLAFSSWNEEIHSKIKIKDSLKVKAVQVENQILSALEEDSSLAASMAVVSISCLSSASDHLCPTCAVTILQALVYLLCLCSHSPVVKLNGELLKATVDALRVLVEKFDIDWKKCFESVCLMALLCEMINIPNISTQVKLSVLKAMNSFIIRFIPPVMAMLVNSEDQEHNSVERLGQVLTAYLADMEWEVRDSALEILISCMTLAKDKYPYFVEWMMRYNLNTAVIVALEDIEGYVRASAFNVLACIVVVDKIWAELEDENIHHRALAAALWEGDTSARKSAISLVTALYCAGKFSEDNVNNLVVNIIQRSAEDSDDEVRLGALEFIHIHIQENLKKSGMVDGCFPTVTFSKGKITKLDKDEVKKRVLNIIQWICDCGYLNCLLMCLSDPATNVEQKAKQIFCFLNDLVNKYGIRTTAGGVSRKKCEGMDAYSKASTKTEDMELKTEDKELPPSEDVMRASLSDQVKVDYLHLNQIDKIISDILRSSTLDNVSSIKRPCGLGQNSRIDPKKVIVTANDVPSRNPAVSLDYFLPGLDHLCQGRIKEGNSTVVNLVSLLDDILLDGCKVEESDGDDQHLRDCY